jgi:hypothetical protein
MELFNRDVKWRCEISLLSSENSFGITGTFGDEEFFLELPLLPGSRELWRMRNSFLRSGNSSLALLSKQVLYR